MTDTQRPYLFSLFSKVYAHGVRLFLLCCLVCLQAACNKQIIKMAYQSADKLIIKNVDKYFDLSDEQKKQLSYDIKIKMNWHQKQALPLYAQDLKDIQTKIEDGVTQEEVLWLFNKLDAHKYQLLVQALPISAAFLTTVTDKQIERFNEKTEKDFQDTEKTLALTKDKRIKKRINALTDTATHWIGSLTENQQTRIKDYAEHLPDLLSVRHQQDKKQQQIFIQLMRAHPDKTTIENALRTWLEQHYFHKDEQEIEARARICALIEQVLAILTPEQKQHLKAKISDYKSIVDMLMTVS